jgi:hypothetical protein
MQLTQASVSPSVAPVSTQRLTYLATKNLLTVSIGGKTEFLSSRHPLFPALVKFLPRSSEFILGDDATSPMEQAKNAVYAQLTHGILVDGKIDGIPVNDLISGKIVTLLAQGLPYQPLLAFWSKLQANSHLSAVDIDRVVLMGATKFAPITWDGDLILYARANMNQSNVGYALRDPSRPVVAPNPATFAPADLRLGTLDHISQMCADVGPMFDFLVNPAEILSVNCHSFVASGGVRISRLTERHSEASSMVSLDASGIGQIVIRNPHDRATALKALPHQAALNSTAVIAGLESQFQMASC